MKQVIWMGSSLKDLKQFPEEVKEEMGYALYLAQCGERHKNAKTLSGIGNADIVEIKLNDKSGTYRIVFTIEFENYLFVLHSFQKKSKKGIATPKTDIDLIKSRLKDAKTLYEIRKK